MDIPFVYGRLAENKNFTGRSADINRLKTNLTNRINTIIISPRRWGKSSLVHRTLQDIEKLNSQFITCHIDIFNCRDEESFYKAYVNAVLNASTTKFEEAMGFVKKYIGSFGPKISISDAGAMMEYSLGIDFHDKQYSVDEILDLPEKIALERGKQFIICIDEFQNIENFDDPKAFQSKLRAHWQLHQNVCYCMYGSKRHMLLNIFSDYEMPFYKFGDIMILDRISKDEWTDFITQRFADTGKHISRELAGVIVDRVESHSYYVQQYSQFVWLLTSSYATEETVNLAFQQMTDRSSILFDNIIDNLKPRQISMLIAIARGEKNFSSAAVLKNYNLGTSANVKNLKKAIIDKDLVNVESGTMSIQDPVFKHWLLERNS